MREKGISQSELARLVKTRQSTVQGWLSGSLPRQRTLVEIANAINVSEAWLLNGTGSPNSNASHRVREDAVPYGGKKPPSGPDFTKEMLARNVTMVDAVIGLLDVTFDKIEAGELPDSHFETAKRLLEAVKAEVMKHS